MENGMYPFRCVIEPDFPSYSQLEGIRRELLAMFKHDWGQYTSRKRAENFENHSDSSTISTRQTGRTDLWSTQLTHTPGGSRMVLLRSKKRKVIGMYSGPISGWREYACWVWCYPDQAQRAESGLHNFFFLHKESRWARIEARLRLKPKGKSERRQFRGKRRLYGNQMGKIRLIARRTRILKIGREVDWGEGPDQVERD